MRYQVVLLALMCAGCVASGPRDLAPLPEGFEAQAIAFLDGLQPRSIADNREYCGYFGLDSGGAFAASVPNRGKGTFCDLSIAAQRFEVLASYHTHAAYDGITDGEIPSDIDLLTDMADGVYGFVSTPGGRVWILDPVARDARQLCGLGCVVSDPGFVPGAMGSVEVRYTLRALQEIF